MAEAYRRMVQPDGTPCDDKFGVGFSLKSYDDVVKALEESYGMIWYIAQMINGGRSGSSRITRKGLLQIINIASDNYEEGLARGRSGS